MPRPKRSADDVRTIYANRFQEYEMERDRVWRVLAETYFQKWVRPTDAVLDVGAGYCEFINNIRANEKFALDLNPATPTKAALDVTVVSQDVCQSWALRSETIDVVFSSNFFEHLHSKQDFSHCLGEAYRVLRRGGLIITMGPNIRFCSDVYWDFFDHHLPLSDRSMLEAITLNGFEKELVIPRFLPFTMVGRRPPASFLIRLYLATPVLWRILGKQFVIVGRKPNL
jgi:SAM-dependent methyltransferase